MRAVVLHAAGDLRVEERPDPDPSRLGPRDCLVRIGSVGVCGSDVHYYEHGRIGRAVVERPMVLGHECAGTVIACGADVTSIRTGDRVALEPGIPCRRCRYCRSGHYNLCPDVVFFATPPIDGSLCDYVVHPDDFLYPLPDRVSLDEGALIEPLAVGVYASRRAAVGPGHTVAVLGCGTIGLMTIIGARASGATRVLATDVQPNRLAVARSLGAEAIDAASADVRETVLDATDGVGADIVFETAGTVGTAQSAVGLVATGGTICLVGLAAEPVFPWGVVELVQREIEVTTVFRYANCFAECVALIADGRACVGSLVTGRYPLEEAPSALEFAATRKGECVKLVVAVSE